MDKPSKIIKQALDGVLAVDRDTMFPTAVWQWSGSGHGLTKGDHALVVIVRAFREGRIRDGVRECGVCETDLSSEQNALLDRWEGKSMSNCDFRTWGQYDNFAISLSGLQKEMERVGL